MDGETRSWSDTTANKLMLMENQSQAVLTSAERFLQVCDIQDEWRSSPTTQTMQQQQCNKNTYTTATGSSC